MRFLTRTPGGSLSLGGGALAGALGIGAATPGPYLYVKGTADGNTYMRVDDSTGVVQAIYGASTGGGGFGGTLSNHAFAFRTNNTARVSFAAGGTTTFTPNGTTTQLQVVHNTTAATTGLLLSVAGAAAVAVTVGAADSGAAGFRLLRVPN